MMCVHAVEVYNYMIELHMCIVSLLQNFNNENKVIVTILWSKTAQLQESGIVVIVRNHFMNHPISTGKLHTLLKQAESQDCIAVHMVYLVILTWRGNIVKIAKLIVHYY